MMRPAECFAFKNKDRILQITQKEGTGSCPRLLCHNIKCCKTGNPISAEFLEKESTTQESYVPLRPQGLRENF